MGTNERMDYYVSSKCISSLGPSLDNSDPGELGISSEAWDAIGMEAIVSEIGVFHKIVPDEDAGIIFTIVKDSIPKLWHRIAKLHSTFLDDGENRAARCLPGLVQRDDSGLINPPTKVNELSGDPTLSHSMEMVSRLNTFHQKFINQSLLRYLLRRGQQLQKIGKGYDTHKSEEIEEIMDSHKYGTWSSRNRSSFQKSPTSQAQKSQGTTIGKVEEYRQVSIVFVKLKCGQRLSPEIAQKILVAFLLALKSEDGVFQQFSVDDKGESMLGVFGLPPWPQKKEQLSALRACHIFLFTNLVPLAEELEHDNIEVRTAIASGQILFSELGNDFRREVSLLGDIVNVAARILSLEGTKNVIACDEATMTVASNILSFRRLGSFLLKGKNSTIDVWILSQDTETMVVRQKTTLQPIKLVGNERNIDTSPITTNAFIGYTHERCLILSMIRKYALESKRDALIIEGPSGSGKSSLLRLFNDECCSESISIWYNIVDQWTPYFGLRPMLMFMYENSGITGNKHLETIELPKLANRYTSSQVSSSFASLRNSHQNKVSRTASAASFGTRQSSNSSEYLDDWTARTFLKLHGEDAKLAPLLGILLPHLKIRDTKWCSTLDWKAKASLIKSMVVRIINKWMAVGRQISLVFDDAQWLDLSSLEVIFDILETVQRQILLLICTRPMLVKLKTSGSCMKVELKGFSSEETEKVIAHKLNHLGVVSIDQHLLDAICSRTVGSPLFTDFVTQSLADQIGNLLTVASNGCMIPTTPDIDVDAILLSDVGAGIRSQFDKLDPDFQSLLRVASIFGQYFNLEEVAAVSELNGSLFDLTHLISTQDSFQFLTFSGSSEQNSILSKTLNQQPAEALRRLENKSCVHPYAFRHISIVNAIYESMPFSRRIELHGCIAEALEMAAETKSDHIAMLPVIAYHYARSDHIERKVDILEELGSIYLSRYLHIEARNILDSLISFVEQSEEIIIKSLNHSAADQILSLERRALWWSMISHGCCQRKLFKDSFKAASEALSLIGIKVDKSPKDMQKAMKKALLKQLVLFFKTKGGKRLLRKKKLSASGTPDIPTVDEQIRFYSFGALLIHSYYDDNATNARSGWIMFELLNAIVPTAAARPVDWVTLCLRAQFGFLWSSKPLSNLYAKSAKSIGDSLGESQHTYTSALIEGLQSKWEDAFGILAAVERFVQPFSNLLIIIRVLVICNQAQLAFMIGDIHYCYNHMLPYVHEGVKLDLLWGAQVAFQICGYFCFTGNSVEARKYCDIAITYLCKATEAKTYRAFNTTLSLMVMVTDREQAYSADDFLVLHESIFLAWEVSIGNVRYYARHPNGRVLTCLSFIPMQRGEVFASAFDEFSVEERQRYRISLKRCEALMRRLGFKRKLMFMRIGWALANLCLESLRQLQKLLITKSKIGKVMETTLNLKAMTLFMLGSRVKYVDQALFLYRKIGAINFASVVEDYKVKGR
ncbi:hypothetical protein BC829DRAFT_385568 [Chytridium lagenaria]|nr:hypothetical protein BC829DRAFT_385568 [Chytridium lagenaria]